MRVFRCYWEGMELHAIINRGSFDGCSLEVYTYGNGHKQPYFDHCYKDERGALRAMKTRFRGAEWEETT